MISLTFSRKTKFNIPQVQSHRGYWIDLQSQNTFQSIKRSYEHGFKMTEFDVRITVDGVAILFHDAEIDGHRVSQLTYDQIMRKISVDRLEIVLEWLSSINRNQILFALNIEIKSDRIFDRSIERKVVDLAIQFGVINSLIISSFNPFTLIFFRFNYPSITRSLLLSMDKRHKGNNLLIRSMFFNIFAQPHYLHLHYEDWSHWFIRYFLRNKIQIVLWTCNDIEAGKRFIAEGAVGLISDIIRPTDLGLEN